MIAWAAIVLNYRRPQNIGRIAHGLHSALPHVPIFVLDQSLNDVLRGRDDVPWHALWHMRARRNAGAGARFALAARLPFSHYLALDDDIFLTAEQLRQLCFRAEQDPSRPHGVWGQSIEHAADGRLRLRSGICCADVSVDILNRVYAFTRAQAVRSLALAHALGREWEEVGPTDDLFISYAGERRPQCHALGALESCVTSDDPDVAVWKQSGFHRQRYETLAQIRAQAVLA